MKIDDAVKKMTIKQVTMVTAQENMDTMERLVEDWHLGPENASAKPGANKEYWSSIAKVWKIPEADARRRLCANCEYFENTPEMMKLMDSVPFNEYDADGGGRGYCHKFEFICHNLRTCQAWERKDFELDE